MIVPSRHPLRVPRLARFTRQCLRDRITSGLPAPSSSWQDLGGQLDRDGVTSIVRSSLRLCYILGAKLYDALRGHARCRMHN